jgi:N-acetylmuramoyl-L-alanine amidase
MQIVNHRLEATEKSEKISFLATTNQESGITPLYLIMHYTAGMTLDGATTWFQNPIARASAHIVIERNGRIVQMVDFNKRAWHAGKSDWGHLDGMNAYSIGIELVNAGKLSRTSSGAWVNWAKNVVPDADVTVARHKDETSDAGWHEYTKEQIEVALEVASTLHEKYKFKDVLGHNDVSPRRKVDPGPLFPMLSFRSRVLGRDDS